MAAYGLYSHIQSNRRRSIALLIGLFFLVYAAGVRGRAVGRSAAPSTRRSTISCSAALFDFAKAFPFATDRHRSSGSRSPTNFISR